MAVVARGPERGLIHYSDSESRYACDDFRDELEEDVMKASMSRKGHCQDNTMAESFLATLEMELITNCRWSIRSGARPAVFEFIDSWYNRVRRHSTLDYLSPMQYQAECENEA